jgi:pimeloyl-ACP methyl ester carboxylesterase
MIDVGSHHLQIRREGTGAPVVVIDNGIADTMDRLGPFQERLAIATHVVTYNRAGYGRSEPGPLPRDARREAGELRALLENAAVPGPYVLVGHSLGGLNAQVFASIYPDDVAGLVLLDPPPLTFILGEEYTELLTMADQMTAEWQSIADGKAGSGNDRERAFFRMIASEHREMFGESARLAAAISTFGEIPLVVVAAGQPNPFFGDVADEYQRYWIEQTRALSLKSVNGRFILAESSSPHLHRDAPDLVADAILSVVRELQP